MNHGAMQQQERQQLERELAVQALGPSGDRPWISPPSVWIHSSAERQNAPSGYLIARVGLSPTVYIDAECNPHTNEKFTLACLYVGDPGAPEAQAICVAAWNLTDPATDVVTRLLRGVEGLFGAYLARARPL